MIMCASLCLACAVAGFVLGWVYKARIQRKASQVIDAASEAAKAGLGK